jgi:hypothetical protein
VSLATDLALATIFAFVGVTVYLLLRRIDRRAPGVLVVFVAMAAGLILINLAFHHAAAGSGSSAVGSHRSDGLVVLLLNMHDHGCATGRRALAGLDRGCRHLPAERHQCGGGRRW